MASFDGRTFRTFNTSHGLANNNVRFVLEAQNGNLWFGTDGGGISVFDGRTFQTISEANGLPSGHIRSLAQAADGTVWAGTLGGGIAVIDLRPDTVLVARITDAHGLPNLKVRALLKSADGRMWAGTDGGLCVFEPGSRTSPKMVDGLPDPKVLCLFIDNTAQLWAGTEHGAVCFEKSGPKTFMEEDGLDDPRIRSIAQDAAGRMWFATQRGVWYLNNGLFSTVTEANGLSNARVRSLLRDRQGNLWFGTWFGGICRFSGADITLFRGRDGLRTNQVTAVLAEADTLWVGTLDGLSLLVRNPNNAWTVQPDLAPIGLFGHRINTIARKGPNEVWVGSDNGITIIKGKKLEVFSPDKIPLSDEVKCVLFARNGTVWVGSSTGVSSYKIENDRYRSVDFWSENNANESEAGTLAEDTQGRIWIGFTRASVVRFADGQFSIPAPLGTIRNIAQVVARPSGEMVVATHGSGLYVVSADGTALRQISKVDGLMADDLNLASFDLQGRLVVGSSLGVDVVSGMGTTGPLGVKHYGAREGFYGSETFERAIQRAPDGTLWIGTARGLTAVGTRPDARTTDAPTTHITQVTLASGSVLIDVLAGRAPQPSIDIPYENNTVQVEFTGIDLSYPENVRYQWRMTGFSDTWSAPIADHNERLTNIPPGTYVFEVRACNADGLCDTTPAQLQIRVRTPFWRTWGFIIAAGIVAALAVLGMVRLRERRARLERERLQRMVDERTRDLTLEKQRSDDLLHNILPHETAEELKSTGTAQARQFNLVTVLFTDFKGFTQLSEQLSPRELVKDLNDCFTAFDNICEKHGIEKIKTIGDAYMAAGGLPTPCPDHAQRVVRAALEMREFIDNRVTSDQRPVTSENSGEAKGDNERQSEQRTANGEQPSGSSLVTHHSSLQIRIGIHTGPVVAGIVGVKKFQYDIWGDTVNTASRMESSGEVGKVNISEATYALVKDEFACEYRGEVEAKGKGRMGMWFV